MRQVKGPEEEVGGSKEEGTEYARLDISGSVS